MNFYTPLEQFEIDPVLPLSVFRLFDFSYTNSSHAVFITVLTAFLFLHFGIEKAKIVPSYWQSVVELVYLFIVDIVKQQAGPRARLYLDRFPSLLTLA